MTKPSGWISACALLLSMATGCSREKNAAAKDSSASSSKLASAARTTMMPGAPGVLSKPLTQYTGDELYTLAHGLNFTGGTEGQRRCRGRAECRGGKPSMFTRVRVDAVEGEDSLSAASIPANGVIAARALNRGQVADSMYAMRPGTQQEYYLIVLPGTAGHATWRLEELTTAANARAHHTVSSGTLTECHHVFTRGARADFKTCSQAALLHQASFRAFPQNAGGDAPIWFSCAEGCCTADVPAGG